MTRMSSKHVREFSLTASPLVEKRSAARSSSLISAARTTPAASSVPLTGTAANISAETAQDPPPSRSFAGVESLLSQ